jgi:tRNA threonylcarbamoyladenosine biosynthesis protein TsaB
MAPRLLLLETSHRVGKAALASGGVVIGERTLDDSRRHARDLVPSIQALLQAQSWRARELDGVIVSRGPGSYTGLRVGLMSAKTLAYATGCPLIAIDTFDAIRRQAAENAAEIDVIADAQQGKIYVQRFGKHAKPLTILAFETWLESALGEEVAVTGPGLEIFFDRIPAGVNVLPRESWYASPAALLSLGLIRFAKGERDDPFAVEPLYLRASSAEEKWDKLHPRP